MVKARPRVVAVSVDDSESSRLALEWTLDNIVQRGDELRIISVDRPCSGPYPAEVAGTDCLLPDLGIMQQYRQEVHEQSCLTQQLLEGHKKIARARKCRSVDCVQLPPHGGASGVARSLVQYSEGAGASMLVVGSRGMSERRRFFMTLLGWGSVSDFVVLHSKCPVIVVKSSGVTDT